MQSVLVEASRADPCLLVSIYSFTLSVFLILIHSERIFTLLKSEGKKLGGVYRYIQGYTSLGGKDSVAYIQQCVSRSGGCHTPITHVQLAALLEVVALHCLQV